MKGDTSNFMSPAPGRPKPGDTPTGGGRVSDRGLA
jgi:hypothetical protein